MIGKDEIQEVIDTLESGWLSKGPKVEAFEKPLPPGRGQSTRSR